MIDHGEKYIENLRGNNKNKSRQHAQKLASNFSTGRKIWKTNYAIVMTHLSPNRSNKRASYSVKIIINYRD